jgi:hypothetical protein
MKSCQVTSFYRLVYKIQTQLNASNMNPFLKISGLVILVTFSSSKYAFAQEPGSNHREPLFIIERSRDTDYLVYDVVEKGKDHPTGSVSIDAYWIKKRKNNRREPLTWIQNQYGYGIEVLEMPSAASDKLHFRIVAFPRYTFILKQDQGKSYEVYIRLDEGEIEVEKLFINFTNNSFWHPEVSHVTLYGLDPHTGARFTGTISPEEMNQNAN